MTIRAIVQFSPFIGLFIQCLLQQRRQQPGPGRPASELPPDQRRSQHPNSPRHLLPLCSPDTAYPHQSLQRNPLALCIQQRKAELSSLRKNAQKMRLIFTITGFVSVRPGRGLVSRDDPLLWSVRTLGVDQFRQRLAPDALRLLF